MVVVKKLYLTILFLFSASTFAIEGTITVLEAPIFKTPDESGKVVQYYRKGQTIFIHSMEAFKDYFGDKEIIQVKGITFDKSDDPLIGDSKVYIPDEDSKFYKTISRKGSEAYILKEHVLLTYKDKREFSRKVLDHDHTDYRIAEPIPKSYPFIIESGYRGLTQMAIGQPNYKPYPYQRKIRDSKISTSKELNFIWSRAEKIDTRQRFFFGVMTGIHFSQIQYLLTGEKATQDNVRFSVGPYASYDIYRTKANALNIYTSSQVYLYDQMKVSIKSTENSASEERMYSNNLGFSQLLGFNYQFFKAVYNFDTVIGTNIRVNLPKTYEAKTGAGNPDFWNSTSKNDEFDQPLSTELSLYFGIQSYY